jgi:hypothetical protein
MRDFRAIYRGYAIFAGGGRPLWSSRAEPLVADLPILRIALNEGYSSRGAALRTAKRQIDHLLK